MDNRGEEMSNIKKISCYILLVVIFVLAVVYMGSICIEQRKQDEESNVRIEKLKEEKKKEVLEKQQSLIANERVVLVKKLPVYSTDKISINKEIEPSLELLKGDKVVLEEAGTSYSLVKNIEGTKLGYVWNDCIGEVSEAQLRNSKVIVIDAGYQVEETEEETEELGAEKTAEKVTSVTTGIVTGRNEHEIVLDIALELEKKLEERGYVVIQVQRNDDVTISNSERAVLANQIDADILIRLYANGNDVCNINVTDVCYISKDNPYVQTDIYDECKMLAECVFDAYTEANPDIENNSIRESDDYTGLSWCEIPSIILEMGYLANEEEDKYLNIDDNLMNIVNGIADGIDDYFNDMYVE